MEIDQVYEVVEIGGDVDVLKEHPQNPNNSADELIDDSIEHNGWYGALTAQKSTGYILAGHGRYRTALKRGATSIPVIWKDVDDETALRILLADNEVPRHSVMDEDVLHEVLSSLSSLDGTGYGSALHGLEQRLQAEAAAEATKSVAADAPPPPGDAPEPIPQATPTPIPDDVYKPDWGIMIVCYSEDDQREVYEALTALQDGTYAWDGVSVVVPVIHGPEGVEEDGQPMRRKLRVVAV